MRALFSRTWAKVGLALLCLPTTWADASDSSTGATISPWMSTERAQGAGDALAEYSALGGDIGTSLTP